MLVYVRGAGDIATGVAARLVRAGVSVVMADIAVPTCIRRTISFCEAIRLGEVQVEGIRARLARTPAEVLAITEAGDVAVVVDPQAKGRGYGSRFVDFYESYALEHGCRYLRMDTNERNASARALYRNLGYREVSIVPCAFNGIPGVQLVCLEKTL